MKDLMRCVAEAVMEHGFKGLLDMVPGGQYAYAVSTTAFQKYIALQRHQQLRDDLRELAEAQFADARQLGAEMVAEIVTLVPAGESDPRPSPEELITLELYLAAMPEAMRQSLKRPDDPTGTTLPFDFKFENSDDFQKILPTRAPKFREGDAVPGRPGWHLDKHLGVGGFGEVWFAQHKKMSALSGAIKFCFGQTGRDLLNEADLIDRVMKAGSHPNIVPLKDAHLEGDSPWLMFEYVPGGSLIDWMHEHAKLPAKERLEAILEALTEITAAVAFFHALKRVIVHRDLKPSNILYDRVTGKLRITDFGIGAVAAKEANRLESRGQSTRMSRLQSYLRGSHTPIYSSPQQRRGDDPDPRDDIHALGVIAYQMLTGKLDAAPGTGARKRLKELAVPDNLSELIQNCVSEEAEDRPKDAVELLRLLNAARPSPAPVRSASKPQRQPNPPASTPRGPTQAEDDVVARRMLMGVSFVLGLVVFCCGSFWMLGTSLREKADLPSTTPREPSEGFKPGPIIEPSLLPRNPKIGDVIGNSIGMKLGWVPPGDSWLGGGAGKPGERKYTQPHGFWAGVYEVTQYEWEVIIGGNPSAFRGLALPVESVSLSDITNNFLPKLNERCKGQGLLYRLPTEDEWEYLCRGGPITENQSGYDFYFATSKTNLSLRPTNDLSSLEANFDGNQPAGSGKKSDDRRQTTQVGTFPRNPLGLYDLLGNVWEWTSTDTGHVLRGGSWNDGGAYCRASFRYDPPPDFTKDYVGFRVIAVPSR
ncbi:MAG: bifunctional serine/threonine-protein kinase/formylglycine-generating enzyme family protein [Fimbriiglobus sp.]